MGVINIKPIRCIDPVVKYCQGCQYGWVEYPDWIETREDLDGCCFKSGRMYGLEFYLLFLFVLFGCRPSFDVYK